MELRDLCIQGLCVQAGEALPYRHVQQGVEGLCEVQDSPCRSGIRSTLAQCAPVTAVIQNVSKFQASLLRTTGLDGQ